jgi:Dyp-type peroxidase family
MSETTVEELSDIQGIVLSGYGHLSWAAFLFLGISDSAAAGPWLRKVAPGTMTSRPWPLRADGTKEKPGVAVNIAFTFQGLQKLNFPAESIGTFAQEFQEGMASRSAVLGDDAESAPDLWELGGPNNREIHALLLLYAADGPALEQLVSRQREWLAETGGGIEEIAAERGHRQDSGKEPFGFHDGLSQPVVEGVARHDKGDTSDAVKKGEFILGYLNEYGMYPVSPVVPAGSDPGGILPAFPGGALPHSRDFGCHGSYLVFRKLEQHVAQFWQFMENDADADPASMSRLASKCVGRWPSGAPLALTPDRDDPRLAEANRFTYAPEDAAGHGCPIGAHIRRANPRDTLINDSPAESITTCSRHRIIRRGIPYGEPAFPPAAVAPGHAPVHLKDDGQRRGLHFIALNGSIARQFEFLTQSWCNNPSFAALFRDKDPIIGSNDGTYFMTLQDSPVRKRIAGLPRFVTTKGGAYFFLPSLSALRFLARP